ncbi:MAG: MmcQ/YjbR family DNA-binding protein [Notoacmeibacter sp.]|nr:MmcQ/YjbR family DNA-binding protein [Notoacmeibacter sp.]
MTFDDYNAFCAALPHANHVVQWRGAHVWKVDTKVFAIGRFDAGAVERITFKCSRMSYDILKEQPGCIPAPHLASRGMPWIQRVTDESMDDEGLRAYLAESHRLAAAALTKKRRRELGFEPG